MYYLIKKDGVMSIKEVENATGATYYELERSGLDVCGCFGRIEYAVMWKDYYNGVISNEELKVKLN